MLIKVHRCGVSTVICRWSSTPWPWPQIKTADSSNRASPPDAKSSC